MQIRTRFSISADGYVTTPDGWPALIADPSFVSGQSHGFPEFQRSCEAVLMGRTTFEPALANDRWPQDRGRWDRAAIADGIGLVTEALSSGPVGVYQLQAAIAAVHAEAPSAAGHRLPAVRGHLLELAGDAAGAAGAYEIAANLTTSLPERDYLQRRAVAARSAGVRRTAPPG
jgi:hypothetical protein